MFLSSVLTGIWMTPMSLSQVSTVHLSLSSALTFAWTQTPLSQVSSVHMSMSSQSAAPVQPAPPWPPCPLLLLLLLLLAGPAPPCPPSVTEPPQLAMSAPSNTLPAPEKRTNLSFALSILIHPLREAMSTDHSQ